MSAGSRVDATYEGTTTMSATVSVSGRRPLARRADLAAEPIAISEHRAVRPQHAATSERTVGRFGRSSRMGRGVAALIAGAALVGGLAMATPTPAAAADLSHRLPKLHPGDHNSLVVRLQRELSAHGRNVAATGHYGKATKKRVKAIQRHHGWKATGVVGSGVWHVLLSDGRRVSSPSIKPYLDRRSSKRKAQSAPTNSVWDKLARCESGGRWHINTGNGFYGGLQFTLSTWHAYGGSGMPNKHSRSEQIAVARRVQHSQGWGAWPACSSRIGLR
jgi:hypothetical protein